MRVSRSQAGFTLTEFGIVVGVIAIMMTVIMIGRGMITSARVGNAVQLIATIRDGARSFSMRNTGGISFTGISIAAMQTQEILPPGQLSPFSPPLGVSIAPNGAGSTFVRIQVCTPTPEATVDLQNSLTSGGSSIGTVTTTGNCVNIVTR